MRRRVVREAPIIINRKWLFVKLVISVILLLTAAGIVLADWRRSNVVGSPYRFNLVVASNQGEVSFVSFDPEEKQVFALPFPNNLEIKSRSVGNYRVENLYKLGSYEGEPGQFVRRKVQGFMRVPIAGYIDSTGTSGDVKEILTNSIRKSIWKNNNTSLSRIDALILYNRTKTFDWKTSSEEDLVRAGVIKKKTDIWEYSHVRLKQYLGVRVFDWAVGGENITVAIVNESGVDGLGSDISEFMSNLGFDVVAVKSGKDEKIEKTEVILKEENDDLQNKEISKLLKTLFGWTEYQEGNTDQYRAKMVVKVGTDAIDLF